VWDGKGLAGDAAGLAEAVTVVATDGERLEGGDNRRLKTSRGDA